MPSLSQDPRPPTTTQRHQQPTLQSQNPISNFLTRQPQWLLLAIASGACAAINGVFAKLTTTSLTTSWSHTLSTFLHLNPSNHLIELLIRSSFFGLNLLFNLAMWTLFTMSLARADSTTRVSIINVSANFMVTAVLGAAIFGERLPLLWWVGAGFLAAGNVVIGRREEGVKPGGTVGLDHEDGSGGGGGVRGEGQTLLGDQEGAADADIIDLDGDVREGEGKAGDERLN